MSDYLTVPELEGSHDDESVRQLGKKLKNQVLEHDDYVVQPDKRIQFEKRNVNEDKLSVVESKLSGRRGNYSMKVMAMYPTVAPVLPENMKVDLDNPLDADKSDPVTIEDVLVGLRIDYRRQGDDIESVKSVVRVTQLGGDNGTQLPIQ